MNGQELSIKRLAAFTSILVILLAACGADEPSAQTAPEEAPSSSDVLTQIESARSCDDLVAAAGVWFSSLMNDQIEAFGDLTIEAFEALTPEEQQELAGSGASEDQAKLAQAGQAKSEEFGCDDQINEEEAFCPYIETLEAGGEAAEQMLVEPLRASCSAA